MAKSLFEELGGKYERQGDYSIDFSMINLYFELSKSAFSNFLMAYAYIFFDSISAILFFIFLPNYFLIVFNYCS